MKSSFWSRPLELSFKDVLAITFSGTFLYFCWHAMTSKDALAVVQTLVPLIGIILGGYFVQESATIWFNRSQSIQQVQQVQQSQISSTDIAPEVLDTSKPI